jgi:diguanylate cyclase (GGDEF)-like protein/PAS domain S-box-containing protein
MSGAPADPTAAASDYEALVEFLYLTPVGIVRFRPDGRIDMANPAAARLLMPLTSDAALSDLYAVFARLLPDLRARVERFLAPTGQIFEQMQLAVPGTRTVLTLGINKIDPDTFMAVVDDISRAIEQERRIRVDQMRFRAIFDNVRDYAIFTVGSDGRIDEWNRSLNRQGGWEPADMAGASIDVFFPTESSGGPSPGATLLDRARRHGTAEFEGWTARRHAGPFWGNTVAAALPDADGQAIGFVLVTRDLTERKQMEDRLVTLATTDALTGALNRRAGDAKLLDAFRDWRRLDRGFAVLMVDCDHFKSINDRWGHEAGDAVLVALVRLCGENLRRADATIRWGGEEFMLLLPETGGDRLLMVAERLRMAIEAAQVIHDGHAIKVTVSIGIAAVQPADTSADDVTRRSDRALYRAKRAGRNRIVVG